jgi:hydrogenase maturation protein HypF
MKRNIIKWEEVAGSKRSRGAALRFRLTVTGRVQGVGFRPSVYRHAQRAGIAGHVRNTRRGVIIEIEGRPEALDRFGRSLLEDGPPLARIDSIEAETIGILGEKDFTILPSDVPGGVEALFPVDTATCDDCLGEMLDPSDRRYRYPFINCTNCGPRFTIIEGLPYDRPLTTMREFSMDRYCEKQYRDPEDRRFHAEPISCPDCGPRLRLLDENGDAVVCDPIEEAAHLLERGMILAVKGLGGYHLAALASDAETVSRLRKQKKRPAKPFAVMFRDMESVGRHAHVSETERRLLTSPEAPIVLLRRKGSGLPDELAPRNAFLGAFLPYTPIHHLIMEHFEVLVMTSANYTDEPLISNETELAGILGSIADAALVHDRRIAHKCDDSILFAPGGEPVPIRRARGYVPEPVALGIEPGHSILALGGQEKGTFTVTKGDKAFVSPHLGDLGDYRSQKNFRAELDEFERILEVTPRVIAHDLHPDYFTTRLARDLGREQSIAVQHHHAHAVSVMTEHGLEGPVIAVTFDGTGYGPDGTLWGGEFLLARYDGFEHLARLEPVPLAGGEQAIREPWRMALVHLNRVYGRALLAGDSPVGAMFAPFPARQVLDLALKGVNAIETSSMGRLFDAVAFLLGCGERVSYEAEAAVALEALARRGEPGERRDSLAIEDTGGIIEIDPAPVLREIADDIVSGEPRETIARAFHESVAAMAVDLASRLSRERNTKDVVIAGGVFQNRLLCELVMQKSAGAEWRLYQHAIVPPNDGGISLGQARVAAAIMRGEKKAMTKE